jgi:hypothetical protein
MSVITRAPPPLNFNLAAGGQRKCEYQAHPQYSRNKPVFFHKKLLFQNLSPNTEPKKLNAIHLQSQGLEKRKETAKKSQKSKKLKRKVKEYQAELFIYHLPAAQDASMNQYGVSVGSTWTPPLGVPTGGYHVFQTTGPPEPNLGVLLSLCKAKLKTAPKSPCLVHYFCLYSQNE